MRLFAIGAGVGLLLVLTASVASTAIVYPSIGSENPAIYSFTAASTGDVVAYFAGSTAAFDQRLGLLVNGVSTGLSGLDNHTTKVGQSFNLGHVQMGDVLTFVDGITGGAIWYSDPTLNSDSGNHVFSTTGSAGQAFANSPAGTYVAFEDLTFPQSDLEYQDQTFVLNISATPQVSAIPEPSSWAMMVHGFAGIGLMAYRRKKNGSAFRVV